MPDPCRRHHEGAFAVGEGSYHPFYLAFGGFGSNRQVKSLANKHFTKMAGTQDNHRQGLPAYFNHLITTGPLEELNNKTKVLKRQAYGFRDNEYFKLRLYFLHESTPSLTG